MFYRSNDPRRNSEDQGYQHCPTSEYDGLGKTVCNVVIDIIVLVLVGRPEITAQDVKHVAAILLDHGFIQMIFGLNVSLYHLGQIAFSSKRTTGCDADNEETQRDDDEKRWNHS
ncbi:hypothetical protein DSECCO2_618720 [anaerobic digester metagenome]